MSNGREMRATMLARENGFEFRKDLGVSGYCMGYTVSKRFTKMHEVTAFIKKNAKKVE